MARLPLGYRPHFLIIKLDDMIAEGWAAQSLPNLVALYKGGWQLFPHGVVAGPLCLPGRVNSFSGQHSLHNHAETNNDGALVNWLRTWAHSLRHAGYVTALAGKFGNGFGESGNGAWGNLKSFMGGFSYFDATFGAPNYYEYQRLRSFATTNPVPFGSAAADYVTRVDFASLANFFTWASKTGRPAAAYLGAKACHQDAGGYAIPDPLDLAAPMANIHLPNFDPPQASINTQPAWSQAAHPVPYTAGELADIDAQQLAAMRTLLGFDRGLAALLDTLEALGMLERMVIMVDADNGSQMGKNGMLDKGSLYEGAINAGLRVRVPGMPNRTCNEVVSHHDHLPTILDLAGLVPSWPIDGMSFAAQLVDPAVPHREAALVGAYKDGLGNPRAWGARYKDKLVGRGMSDGTAAGQKWVWPDVGSQLTSRAPTDQELQQCNALVQATLTPGV